MHEFAFLNIKLQIVFVNPVGDVINVLVLQIVFVNPVGDVINVLLQQCIISCACNWSIKQQVVSI